MDVIIPDFAPKALQKGFENGRFITTELRLEKRCTLCQEYYPADSEFYYTQGKHDLHPNCKACYNVNRRMRRTNKGKTQ